MSMARFDTLEQASWIERVLATASNVLLFPIVTLATRFIDPLFMPGLLGWVPVLLNSALWASVLVVLRHFVVSTPSLAQRNRHVG
jgi:hypothetical protein